MRVIDGPTLQYYYVAQPTSQQQGLPLLEEGLRLARDIGWRAGESFALAMLMLRLFANGQTGKAMEAGDKGYRIACEIGHHQWQTGHLIYKAIMYNNLFLEEEAIQLCEEGLEIARDIGSKYWLNMGRAVLAEALLLHGDVDGVKATLEGVTLKQMHMDTAAKRCCWAMRAELVLAQGQPDQTLAICEPLIESIPGMSPGSVISPLWELRARAMVDLGRWDKAASLLHEALIWSTDVGERYLLWRIHAGLARCYRELGLPEEAANHNSSARSEIDRMAASIPDESRKERFRRRANETLNG
jgi:tetratricopeptide (TPR) repeat protein